MTAQRIDTFKEGSKVRKDKALVHNSPVRVRI